MSEFLVCPFTETILSAISGRSVVFRVENIEDLRGIRPHANEYSIHIHCIVFTTPTLTAFPLDTIDSDLPIALHASCLGSFPSLLRMLPALRHSNLRVYLPMTHADRFSELRILSSLGIHTAGVFCSDTEDWERVTDLMTYALLGRAPHAPIFPFQYLATRYHPQTRRNWTAVYFDDPATYVHVDAEGHLAFQLEEMKREQFLDLDFSRSGDLTQHPDFLVWQERWKSHFLQNDLCSRCPGWRACSGLFASQCDDGGCRSFFSEFLDCVEQYQARTYPSIGREEIWQP